MEATKQELKEIFNKLDMELHELQYPSNTEALIQISADFKDMREVIQYFEASIDTLKTQNESLKEILKATIREMLHVKEKMIDGIINVEEFRHDIDDLYQKLEELNRTERLVTPSIFPELKKFLDNLITPKIIVVSLAVILLILGMIFIPEHIEKVLDKVTPTIEKVLK